MENGGESEEEGSGPGGDGGARTVAGATRDQKDALRAEVFRLIDAEIDRGYLPALFCFVNGYGGISVHTRGDIRLGPLLEWLRNPPDCEPLAVGSVEGH